MASGLCILIFLAGAVRVAAIAATADCTTAVALARYARMDTARTVTGVRDAGYVVPHAML